jgi:prepilin-type N-terminal cleavage/methylation domain-containing protein
MFATFSHRLAALRSTSGLTLIEMLVAMVIALVLFAAMLDTLESSQEVQARDTEWAQTLQEGRTGLARMAREVREAWKVEEAKANLILFYAKLAGTNWTIKYECGVAQTGTSYTECVRYAVEEGKTLPSTGTIIVRDVQDGSEVFSYSPSTAAPTVVTFKVELPAAGTLKQQNSSGFTHHVVLENAAYMRNLYLEG